MFIGSCVTPPCLSMVWECAETQTLFEFLKCLKKIHSINRKSSSMNKRILENAKNEMAVSFNRRIQMGKAVAYALDYLHSLKPPVLHTDLSSHTILVDRDLGVKVVDFGLQKIKAYNAVKTRKSCVAWTAPEVFKGFPYSTSSDVYSFGIVLWELVTKRVPWCGQDPVAISHSVLDGIRPNIPQFCPKDLSDLIKFCWSDLASSRPMFYNIAASLEKMKISVKGTNGTNGSHASGEIDFDFDGDFYCIDEDSSSSTRSRLEERDLIEEENIHELDSPQVSNSSDSPP